MATVRSTWTAAPINIAAAFAPAAWAGAGQLDLPVGHVLVKNDAQFVYLAFDLTGDTGNSPGTSDYFWLTFDVDRNRSITPRVDINYGTYPTLPIKIGHQYYLGPGRWTGLQPGASTAAVHQTFAATPASPTPHRIWQIRIPFSEIGVSLAGPPPTVPFGLRVASSTPAFTHDSPSNFSADFAGLHDLVLATSADDPYPAGAAGVVIGGVGNIPATVIDAGGRATTAAAYNPFVQNAAFGGVLNLLGNQVTMQSLWAAGARKYRVLHRIGSSGAFEHFRQNWYNYHWTGGTYALESFGPDAADMYPLPNPADDYSIQKLLLQWNTYGAANVLHQFQVEFFNAASASVASAPQTLGLLVDNSAPDLEIVSIRYRGVVKAPCDIVQITAPPAPVEVEIRALDAAGNLNGYALTALYGQNQVFSPALASGSYPGSGTWPGIPNTWISAPLSFPPVTCAYQFRLSASKRITNGYGYIGSWEFNDHLTLQKV